MNTKPLTGQHLTSAPFQPISAQDPQYQLSHWLNSDFGSPQRRLMAEICERLLGTDPLWVELPVALEPLGYYALPALMSDGLNVVIVPDEAAVVSHLAILRQMGFDFPQVGGYYQGQALSENETVVQATKDGQLRLLLTHPAKFNTLGFLDVMVHAPVQRLIIEQAHWLLPQFEGFSIYRAIPEALAQLKQWPVMTLFTAPLSNAMKETLQKQLGLDNLLPLRLSSAEPLEMPTQSGLPAIQLQVYPSEHHKAEALLTLLQDCLQENPKARVLIYTATDRHARKITQLISRYPHLKTLQEDLIQVAWDYQHFQVLGQLEPQILIYWDPPRSLDSLSAAVFYQPGGSIVSSFRIFWLTSKHDEPDVQDKSGLSQLIPSKDHVKLQKWLTARKCRLQTLSALQEGLQTGFLLEALSENPCGQCDICLGLHTKKACSNPNGMQGGWSEQVLHWLSERFS